MAFKKFKILKALKKGLYLGGGAAVGIVATIEAVGGTANVTNMSAAAAIGALLGGVRIAVNWYKVNRPS